MRTIETNKINGITCESIMHWPVVLIQVRHPSYDYPIYTQSCSAWGWRAKYRAVTALVALISRDDVVDHDNADRMDDVDEP